MRISYISYKSSANPKDFYTFTGPISSYLENDEFDVDQLYDLLDKIIVTDQGNRINIDQIMNHPFMEDEKPEIERIIQDLPKKKKQISKKQLLDNHLDLNMKMRPILMDWLLEVSLKFYETSKPITITMDILDRYFLKTSNILRKNLQLVGIVSFHIATKILMISSVDTNRLHHVCGKAYTLSEIEMMEYEILKVVYPDIIEILKTNPIITGLSNSEIGSYQDIFILYMQIYLPSVYHQYGTIKLYKITNEISEMIINNTDLEDASTIVQALFEKIKNNPHLNKSLLNSDNIPKGFNKYIKTKFYNINNSKCTMKKEEFNRMCNLLKTSISC